MSGTMVGHVGIYFDEILYMQDLSFFEPNYYFIKLHVSPLWLINVLLCTNSELDLRFASMGRDTYFTHDRLSVIADHLLSTCDHTQGCSSEGLVSVLGDILDNCMTRIYRRCSCATETVELVGVNSSGLVRFNIIEQENGDGQ